MERIYYIEGLEKKIKPNIKKGTLIGLKSAIEDWPLIITTTETLNSKINKELFIVEFYRSDFYNKNFKEGIIAFYNPTSNLKFKFYLTEHADKGIGFKEIKSFPIKFEKLDKKLFDKFSQFLSY